MSVQFVVGPSGSGKSTYLENKIISMSMMETDRKFLLIVPDQYNMETQKRMIIRHPNHAFSNIEVLSFSRLSHRILEEVGGDNIPVLDDTGKSLIIRHIAEGLAPKLSVLQNRLGKIGFIHEVKSAISEFMQYGIKPEDINGLIDEAGERRALANKLNDLQILYRGFMDYKAEQYMTREETLEKVRDSLHNSKLVKNAYICFDGFTGFTPIQESVIEQLFGLAGQVSFSFTLDEGIEIDKPCGEQELFWLTLRSISRLKKLAEKNNIPEDNTVIITRQNRSSDYPDDLFHLEKNIFRYPVCCYTKPVKHIHIYKAVNIRQEITDTCQRIIELTRNGGYRYRDISIVAGDLGAYADQIAEIAGEFGIPCYLDYSRSVTMNPFIEALRSIFDVVLSNFSTESVMRFLRTGYGLLDREEADELENYLLRTGKRGIHSYKKVWADNDAELSDRVNRYRDTILNLFDRLQNDIQTAREFSEAVFYIMTETGMYQKLMKQSAEFENKKNLSKASEYKQIYHKIVALLDQIVSLIGDEKMTLREYRDIFEAGFGEIKLGVIPQTSDVVLVGDITRSRIKSCGVVLFLGVNDCNIPGALASGGIISDLDREYIRRATQYELAPTPRDQAFTQRLYLYMNMSKADRELYLSYVQMDIDGKSMQPSYLIRTLCKLYPQLVVSGSADTHTIADRILPAGRHLIGMNVASLMCEYAEGVLCEDELDYLAALAGMMINQGNSGLYTRIYNACFGTLNNNMLSEEIARRLYGTVINTSVSRLERFAACAYSHFLTYGMRLRERTEYSFERTDMGDVFHSVLEAFGNRLKADGISWKDYTDELSHEIVSNTLNELVMTYGETILLSSSRTQALARRMGRILRKTVDNLKYQIRQGDFEPEFFETGFKDFSKVHDNSGHEIKINVIGKIDRIDIASSNGNKYLRVVDYKSGNKNFDINGLLTGLTLQLSVYLSEALKANPDCKEAGMLYYHIDDPMISNDDELSDDSLQAKIHSELKMTGVVIDNPDIIALHDNRLDNHSNYSSDVIPAGYKKDGTMTSASSVLSEEEFRLVLKYADKKIKELTKKIMSGSIEPVPCTFDEKKLPCTYCSYSLVCPIKSGAQGTGVKVLEKLKDDEALAKIMNELEDNR